MATLSLSTIRQNLIKFEYSGLGIPALVLMIMGMLVLPLHEANFRSKVGSQRGVSTANIYTRYIFIYKI